MVDTLEEFCGEKLWDNNLSWNTSSPELTKCFNKTILVWIPPAFLLIFSPLVIKTLVHNKLTIEWNHYNKLRQLVSLIQVVVTFAECITVMFYNKPNLKPSSPDISSSSIRFLASVSIFILFLSQKRRGMHTSGVIWFYFLLSIICGAPALHASIHWYSIDFYEWVFFVSQYSMTILLFLIYCFADTLPKSISKKKSIRPECPKENASFLSRLTFNWFNTIALLGWKKPLTINDLWQVRDRDKSSAVFVRFNQFWLSMLRNKTYRNDKNSQTNGQNNIQTNGEKVNSKTANVIRPKAGVLTTIAKTFWFYWLSGAFIRLISELLTFVNPQIMKLLMAFIGAKDEPSWHGYLYAILLFLITMTQILLNNYYMNRMMIIGMKIRACLVASVYRKSLRLSNTARSEATTGEIVNLMAIDSQRFLDMTQFINVIWSAPLQIVISLYFLWMELGIAVLGGLAVMLLMVPVNYWFQSKSKKLQIKLMDFKDERVKAMNEILNGIKILKLYGWEKAFMNDVLKIRAKELNNLKIINYYECLLGSLWFCAPFLVSFVTFALYVIIENTPLTAEKAFVSLALFGILRFPLSLLPNLVTNIITTSVSLKRLNKFLNASELSGYVTHKYDENNAISIEKSSFSWRKESENNETEPQSNQTILENINVEIAKNSFVAIVGSVGSGKSSLLSAILGDMEIDNGSVNICSSMKIAYVPQQAWIQNASLRDNIIFGNEVNEKRYDRVIQACALGPDLAILPGGDATEIGEKGINLSGGQKQRVSLARACFNDANLYLFDDPLSAVDSHVGKHIYDEVINSKTGLLKDKTRVLVTNSLTVLPFTDKIIVLKNGKISEMGTYQELLDRKQHFYELIEEYATNASTDTESYNNTNEGKSNDNNDTENEKTKLVETERAETGGVKLSVYMRYFRSLTMFWCVLFVTSYALMQTSGAGLSLWLAHWSEASARGDDRTMFYILIYGAIGIAQPFFVAFGWYSLTNGIVRASTALHFQMLDRIMHSPISFFDTTPLGRILNRFSKDVDTCDGALQWTIRDSLVCGFQTLATLVIISIEVPMFLAVIVPIAILFFIVQKFYVTTSRQLKRLESITKSPIYSHFSETLSGVSTIRAYDVKEWFINESDQRVDLNNCCFYPNIVAYRWLSVRLEMIANLIILFSAGFAVVYKSDMDPSQVGLIVTYALSTTANLNWLVRTSSEIEINIVGVERIFEYTDLETEAEWEITETAPQSGWPSNGDISFKQYSTKYRAGLDLVIRDINFEISRGEKIGIVGRTGAGKSSLTLALFRLIEPTNGQIVIDGINISDIGLHQLRSRLTIIPQDPILFSGTIRSNLDPFSSHTDEGLWRSLELAHLKSFVQSLDLGLEHIVSEGGENLSVGQRQLICLARALLRNTKVLILDEATAAVDLETDSLIQTTIRQAFADCTVLTIAHRLHTIMDSNRVLVLNGGRIAEFDSPSNLLSNSQSMFYSLARDAGILKS